MPSLFDSDSSRSIDVFSEPPQGLFDLSGDGPEVPKTIPEVARGRGGVRDALWRLRLPIALTAWLAAVEVAYVRLGPGVAATVGIGLPIAVAAALALRGVAWRRLTMPLGVVLGGIAFLLARSVTGTMAAAGVGALVALAVSTHVWRLKLRHLMVLLVLVAVVIRLGQTGGPALFILPVAMLPPMVVVGLYLLLVRRPEFERDGLVGVLAMAAREALPLSPAARAYGELCSVGFRERVNRLSAHLEGERSLSAAAAAVPGVLPSDVEVLAGLGARGSMLAPALRQGVAAREAQNRDPVSLKDVVEYPLLVVAGVTLVSFFLLGHVTPRLRLVMSDMGTPVPALSASVFSRLSPLGNWSQASPEALLFGLAVVVAAGLIVGIVLWALNVHGLLPPGPRAWLRRRREVAVVLRGMSVGMEAGDALPETMRALACGPLVRWTRRRVLRACGAAEQGTAWPEALRMEGLVTRAEAGVLEASERVGNPVWALREVADSRERRLAYRVKILKALAQPVMIASLGGLVLLIVMAYFMPLVDMIMKLTELE
jgi:general secretion pathway protein F